MCVGVVVPVLVEWVSGWFGCVGSVVLRWRVGCVCLHCVWLGVCCCTAERALLALVVMAHLLSSVGLEGVCFAV